MDVVASPSLQSPSASPGLNGIGTPFPPVTVDPVRVVEHLAAALEALLGATRSELETAGSLLHKSRYQDTLHRCGRFANDSQASLYVQKDLASEPQMENGVVDEEHGKLPPVPSPADMSWKETTYANVDTRKQRPSRTPTT